MSIYINNISIYLSKLPTFTYLALILILISANFKVMAIEVGGLYKVEVAVKDQTPTKRWKAALTGFKEVLVRKSGSREILGNYEVQKAYAKVTRYIQRFEYARNNDLTIATNKNQDSKLAFIISITFDPRLVEELIQSAGMPIWGSNRPLTILWLAVEQDFKRQMLTEQSNNNISNYEQALQNNDVVDPELETQVLFNQLIQENAIRRGVPVILPKMDMDDKAIVSLSDIWGRFNDPITQASKRYGADTFIAGRVAKQGQSWQAKLTYVSFEEEQRISLQSLNKQQLIKELTDKLAELLCAKYCVVETAEPHKLAIQISNVNNYAALKKIQSYLEGLSSVRKIEIEKASTTNLLLKVNLLGDVESVKDALRFGNRLVEDLSADRGLFKPQKNLGLSDVVVAGENAAFSAQSAGSVSEKLDDTDFLNADLSAKNDLNANSDPNANRETITDSGSVRNSQTNQVAENAENLDLPDVSPQAIISLNDSKVIELASTESIQTLYYRWNP